LNSNQVNGWARARGLVENVLRSPGKLVASAGALIGVILGITQLVQILTPPPKQAERSILFIVDTSQAMRARYGRSGTRLDAVKRELLRVVLAQPDVLIGVRVVGGVCRVVDEEPAVPFGKGNADEITEALAGVNAEGKANIAVAVGQGANDFIHGGPARTARRKSMWVFLGTARDPCGSTSLANAIGSQLQAFDIPVTFDFFGLARSKPERKELVALAGLRQQGHEVYVMNPATPTQLQRKVEETSRREAPSE